jgi:hypothetical protein
MKTQQSTQEGSLDRAGQDLEAQLASLFARCPDLCGFSVRNENDDLYVSDVGIAPRLSADHYGEIFQDIAKTLAELLEERPEACELVSGRTFARSLQ